VVFFFFFLVLGLNAGPHAYSARTLPLEPLHQPGCLLFGYPITCAHSSIWEWILVLLTTQGSTLENKQEPQGTPGLYSVPWCMCGGFTSEGFTLLGQDCGLTFSVFFPT
jgi:hypothetical protein